MDSQLFEELEHTLTSDGPSAALGRLCTRLRESKDYNSLFYALLMEKRHQLGVSPIPTAPSQDLPEEALGPYEDAIRQAGRTVGNLYLQEGNLPQAWAYFRMLGEPEPMRRALDQYQPKEDEDLQALVQIAFYEGVHPRRGFDWILKRYGICSAITTLSSQELPHPTEVKQGCIKSLVRALYAELRERLTAEIERRQGTPPAEAAAPAETPGVVRQLVENHPSLFEEEFYHIDISHLSSVVQMSVNLSPCPELGLARELCAYGQRLSGRFQNPGEPPFEDQYKAYGIYLSVLAGDHVEQGLDYFRSQADNADPETVGTYPAEVLVNLLLRLDRVPEALAVARKHLAKTENRPLTCPGIADLCQRARDFRTLAEVAREQGDPVHFMAGLLAAGKG
jgi:hypothetical protein